MKLQTSLYAVLTALAAVSVSAGPTPGPAGRNTITKIQDTKTIVDAIKSDDYQGDAKSKVSLPRVGWNHSRQKKLISFQRTRGKSWARVLRGLGMVKIHGLAPCLR